MRWTSVKERVPEYNKAVLLLYEDSEIVIGSRYRTDFRGEHYCTKMRSDGGIVGVTHWINLPAVPGTKNKKG